MVRVWRIGKQSQTLEASMKDHKGAVNCIRVKRADDECVSASSDGSCIIWDLHTFKRRTSLFANTFFKSVVYHPDESQLVTTGTDRKVRLLFPVSWSRARGPVCSCSGRAGSPLSQSLRLVVTACGYQSALPVFLLIHLVRRLHYRLHVMTNKSRQYT